MSSPARTRVVILFGGRSAEHEVSMLSARNVLAALDRSRFQPVLIGIDKQGHWRAQSEALLAGATGDPRLLRLDDSEVSAPTVALASSPSSITQVLASDDVVFPVLHGTYGEDGTVQGLLELADVAYVGAGVLGSAIGMDKDVAKRLLRGAGIPIVAFRVVTPADLHDDPRVLAAHAGALGGYPLFVKPANAGSSVGVSKVLDPVALEPAVRAAFAFDRKVLLETSVDAREVEVAVLGNDRPAASVPAEVIVHHRDGFYSYDAKYVDADGAAFRIPADLPPELTRRVQDLAVATFRALELSGMARVDFFVDRTTSAVFVNEVNTIPGFTANSMYPKMWEASGLSATALVTRLIDLAMERRDARRSLSTSVSGWGR